MTPGAWVAVFGVLATMVLAAAAAIFWAGKVTAKLDILITDVREGKGKIDVFEKTFSTKQEVAAALELSKQGIVTALETARAQQNAMWARLDSQKKKILKLLVKDGFDITDETL